MLCRFYFTTLTSQFLLHDDCVFVFDPNVLLKLLALEHFFVIELDPLIPANDHNVLPVGKLFKSAGRIQGIEHLYSRDQRLLTGAVHLAGYIKLLAVDL